MSELVSKDLGKESFQKIKNCSQEVRQQWYESFKDQVTNLPPAAAVEQLTRGCGFVLYTNLYQPEDMEKAH